MCRAAKLSYDDMELMTIGMCLDYMDEYNDFYSSKTDNKSKTRKATQADIQALKGR